MKRLLVFGGTGFVGGHLLQYAVNSAVDARSSSRHGPFPVDIRDGSAVRKIVERERPDYVVNTAAISNIDYAEAHPEEAFAINSIGAENIAVATKSIGARGLFVSTDAVFNGKAESYAEYDEVNPVNIYGRSKVEGESRVLKGDPAAAILRVSLVLGFPVNAAGGFLASLREKLETGADLRAVEKEIRTPIDVMTMSETIVKILYSGGTGTYHLAAREPVGRLELTRKLASALGYQDVEVTPAAPEVSGRRAPRHERGILEVNRLREELEISVPSLDEVLQKATRGV